MMLNHKENMRKGLRLSSNDIEVLDSISFVKLLISLLSSFLIHFIGLRASYVYRNKNYKENINIVLKFLQPY